jgi:hypothetical protein
MGRGICSNGCQFNFDCVATTGAQGACAYDTDGDPMMASDHCALLCGAQFMLADDVCPAGATCQDLDGNGQNEQCAP